MCLLKPVSIRTLKRAQELWKMGEPTTKSRHCQARPLPSPRARLHRGPAARECCSQNTGGQEPALRRGFSAGSRRKELGVGTLRRKHNWEPWRQPVWNYQETSSAQSYLLSWSVLEPEISTIKSFFWINKIMCHKRVLNWRGRRRKDGVGDKRYKLLCVK